MTNPQQPEIRCSGRGATDQDSAKAKAESSEGHEDARGGRAEKGREPVPPEQQSPYPS